MEEPLQHDVLIAFGSNLGDPREQYKQAVVNLLRRLVREESQGSGASNLTATSAPLETKAVGGPRGQPVFVNGAIRIRTSLKPEKILEVLTGVEQSLGRDRIVRWGARRADLDLLLYGDLQIDTPELTIPHPRMTFRRFVLEPALEIAAAMIHSPSGLTVQNLVDHLNSKPNRILIIGRNENEAHDNEAHDNEAHDNEAHDNEAHDNEAHEKVVPDRLKSHLEADEEYSQWSIEIIQTPEEFELSKREAKLVVMIESGKHSMESRKHSMESRKHSLESRKHSEEQCTELFDVARRFAGPTLRIRADEDLQIELTAAIQAMK